jgi:hypothetical protein
MDVFTRIVPILVVGVLIIGAIALSKFVKRRFNIVITYWSVLFCFFSLGSLFFYISNKIKPFHEDDWFLGYTAAFAFISLI